MFRAALSPGLASHALACGLGVLIAAGTTAEAADTTNSWKAAAWEPSFRATVGGGYRDNILRTSVSPESSPFLSVGADASLLHLAESGAYFTLFVLGEDTRYFDSESVPKEQIFSGSALFELPVGEADLIGANAQYLYQNQVVDASITETNLDRVLVVGHSVNFTPDWKHVFSPGWTLQLDGLMYRQTYDAELDDFWEGGGRVSLLHRYGRKSELSLGIQTTARLYDTRQQYNEGGTAIPGTSLTYLQHEVRAQWRHHWDEGRHWRTTTRASLMASRDNGSGYFDYNRVILAEQVRWANHGWEVKVQARLNRYFYPEQQVGNEQRLRTDCVLEGRIERRLGKYFFLYAAAEQEWSLSNDPPDDYRDWMATGGLGADF